MKDLIIDLQKLMEKTPEDKEFLQKLLEDLKKINFSC